MSAYYDPYDAEINVDPYSVYRRLREEAPVYYNEKHDFYAVSRHDDVERGLRDKDDFISSRSSVLEFIKAGVEFPSGIVIFEDPPRHTVHRGLLSRVFTPRKMAGLEPQVRDYCVRVLDRLVGREEFDFVRDFGFQVPMRVIGLLLGIPEQEQEKVRTTSTRVSPRSRGNPMPTWTPSRATSSPTTSSGGARTPRTI